MAADGTWDDARWHRYGLLAGVAFAVLNVISVLAAGSPPARDASAVKIGEYFVDNADGMKLAAILFGLSLIFGLWWLGSLWRVIGRLEPAGPRLALIAVLGFVMSGAVASVGQALLVTPALRIDTLGGTAEFVWSAGYVTFSFVLAVTAAHMLALGALVLWTKFLPAWLGWLALLSALGCAIATFGAGTEAAVFAAAQLIGFLAWLLWVLIASILLYTRAEA
jgi:hypothetical protein